jgi:hypothetical protein
MLIWREDSEGNAGLGCHTVLLLKGLSSTSNAVFLNE